jgi:hypothetical protein
MTTRPHTGLSDGSPTEPTRSISHHRIGRDTMGRTIHIHPWILPTEFDKFCLIIISGFMEDFSSLRRDVN